MEFRTWWILLLAIPLIPIAFQLYRRTTSTMQFSSLRLMDGMPKTWRARFAFAPALLLAIGVGALIAALAGPRLADDQTRIRREGIAIMMIVDRSSSMNARDLVADDQSINRLAVVKDVFRRFVLGDRVNGAAGQGRPDDMVGLVSFAGFADSICPLTYDHLNLATLSDQAEIADRSEDGTAIGDGLALAVERLYRSQSKSKVAILLTDGENTAGVIEPEKAAELAAEKGVRVYCIGTGTNGLAPVPTMDAFGRVFLTPIQVRIDEKLLEKIADMTGGEYFRATDATTLEQIYQRIDQLERTEISQDRFLKYTEIYPMFLIVGIVAAALGLVFDRTLFRRLP